MRLPVGFVLSGCQNILVAHGPELRLALERLCEELPPASEASSREDMEHRCRAALAVVTSAALSVSDQGRVSSDPTLCPNCDACCTSERSPYCGGACRDEAAFVRQVRSGLIDGSVLDQVRQVAMGQVFWSLLGGGYPLRQSLVLERSRAVVYKRSGGLCENCGAPATEVDHIATACNRPINLRAVCRSCSKTRPFGDKAILEDDAVLAKVAGIAARLSAQEPIRCCDDAASWDWRAYLAARKSAAEA